MTDSTRMFIERWRAGRDGTYQTWLLWPERLKNFRSIRRDIGVVVNEIQAGTFGNTYRGSPLETVASSITKQHQILKGVDHAFPWKPKLRIPDIYENASHQRAFARLLHTYDCCDTEQELIQAIQQLNQHGIKGLGPTVVNLLYFTRPTLAVPFNTVIASEYDTLTGFRVKLRRWDHYLAMCESVLSLNGYYRGLLPNNLGVVTELPFDVGMERYLMPPREDDVAMIAGWESNLAKVREEAASFAKQLQTG